MKKAKRIMALAIAVLMIVSALASCVKPDDNDTIITIRAGGDILEKGTNMTVLAVASNGGDVTLSVDRNDIVEVVNNMALRVKDNATITSDIVVTLTATLNEDPTVNATYKFTVKADVEKVRVSLNVSDDNVDVNGTITLVALATDNSEVRIRATGENANLVKIENNKTLTVVGEITMDTAVTIVAELVDDPTIFTTKVITINGPKEGSWIKITPTKYTITNAADGYAIINVTSYNNGKYTVTISGDEDKNAYYNPASMRLMVVKDVKANKEITLTATLNDEPNVTHSVTITLAPAPVVPTITISTKDNKDSVSKETSLDLNIKVSTDEAYDLTVSDSSLVEIVGAAGSEKLTVIGNNTFDKTVTVTATLRNDPTVKTSKTFVVTAPRIPGKVSGEYTELTTKMFEDMAKSITISGSLTDVYENFNEKTVTSNNYDIVVKMVEGKWYGAWNAVLENNAKGIVNEDTYIMSNETATVNGVTGHIMKRIYIDKNNQIAQKSIVDYRSIPVLWENQHLWNHFDVDTVDNYSFRKNESKDGYEVYEFTADKTSIDVAYFLTYLAYAYTPLLSDTLDKVYLKVDINTNKITGMIAYTEFLYQGASSEADGASAVSYSKLEINFTDVGTTEIPEINTYSEPTHADVLQAAINNMKGATNYTFTAIEKTTYAPSVDDGDYTIESVSSGDYVQTMSTIKNYSASVSPLNNGDVGLRGYITNNVILIQSTFKYSASMDENVYRIEHYGYYQKSEDYYDYYTYNADLKGFEGKQQYLGSIVDVLPKWDFSANIFEFIGSGGTSSTPTYKFRLRDGSITRDVAMAVSMHSYSRDGSDSATRRMEIEVAADGSRVVSTMYPYSITSGTYMGYITTTYSNVGATTIDSAEFEGYSPREISPLWSAYQLRYYHPDHDTRSPYAEGTGETILKIMFGDDWTKFPAMTVFTDAFGDHISGPFFEWDEIENPNGGDPIYKDYFSLTADTDDYDENMTISYETYKRIIDKLTEGLQKAGFTVSFQTPKQDPADRTDRYISYINEELGCQIVVENNHTKNFWIDIGYLGDWSFN